MTFQQFCADLFEHAIALQNINEAVEKCDAPKLRQALLDPNLGLNSDIRDELLGIGDDDAIHFLCLMRDFKSNLR